MDNQDTTAAWHYHNGTKHPDGALMRRDHVFDFRRRPYLFKDYDDPQPLRLPLDKGPGEMAALAAISQAAEPGEGQAPTAESLARLLYFSAGVTKRITRPWAGEILFRAAACTGALYHIELYLVCGELPGLAAPGLGAGVYHYDPKENVLNRLRAGDYRAVLVEASGQEEGVAQAPAVIVFTDVPWRNAVKYQAREYRHAFWDCGTILAHTLALAAAHDLPAKLVMGFVDGTVNELLGLDGETEFALAMVPVGRSEDLPDNGGPDLGSDLPPVLLASVPVTERVIRFPAIGEMHGASALGSAREAAEWRAAQTAAGTVIDDHKFGRTFPLEPLGEEEMPPAALESVILRRGSTRQFNREPIGFRELSTALHYALGAVSADFLPQTQPAGGSQSNLGEPSLGQPSGGFRPPEQHPAGWPSLTSVFLIVNAVEGLQPGIYYYQRDHQALTLLKEGDFRFIAGELALGQELAEDAAVNVYFLTDLEAVLAQFGNRGYRAAQMEAAVMAGRMYLAAYAQRFGATGLTFFDDAVTEFFSPPAEGLSVMFLMALGHKAQQG